MKAIFVEAMQVNSRIALKKFNDPTFGLLRRKHFKYAVLFRIMFSGVKH